MKHSAAYKQCDMSRFITELWLSQVGFKPHWFANQPNRHWLLWLGEDLGLELQLGMDKAQRLWFCWARTSGHHAPEKFVHIRYLTSKHEVITIVQALTGKRWNPKNHRNGSAVRLKGV